MVKEALEAISEKMGDLSCNSRVDCCCPAFIFFVFKVNCVQIFSRPVKIGVNLIAQTRVIENKALLPVKRRHFYFV